FYSSCSTHAVLYPLSLHDALPICGSSEKTRRLLDRLDRPAAYVPIDISEGPLRVAAERIRLRYPGLHVTPVHADYTTPFSLPAADRKSTRLNSSHVKISYAVFCLK